MMKGVRLPNGFALRKCQNGVPTSEDRISQLPDDMLVYILSFLTVKEAADTSVLSRRWLSLWRYIFRLDFDATKPLLEVALQPKLLKRQMNNYLRWVSSTLEMCKGQRLVQFRVRFGLTKFAQRDIDKWLEFAFSRKVETLELDLLRDGMYIRQFSDCYTFPGQLLGLGEFVDPSYRSHLNIVQRLPLDTHNFEAVRVLLFKSVNVTGEVLEFFLHNCPFLEQMVVRGSGTLVNLEVSGRSLKLRHLEILHCFKVKSLRICDTNLVSLRTSAGNKLLLKNVPMLVEVYFSGTPFTHILDDTSSYLSCVLSRLEVLTLHTADPLHETLGNYNFPELTKLKKFVLELMRWENQSLFGCTSIIRAAPHMEEFELQIMGTPVWSNRECRKAKESPLYHLKVVKLWGYYSGTIHLEFVRYFLENAVALNKIIIDPRNPRITPLQPERIKREKKSRSHAKRQLEGEVRQPIELVIL